MTAIQKYFQLNKDCTEIQSVHTNKPSDKNSRAFFQMNIISKI